jgi:polyferredoxin
MSCTMSQIATIFSTIQLRIPFFGLIFVFANVIFLVAWLIGLAVSVCQASMFLSAHSNTLHTDN